MKYLQRLYKEQEKLLGSTIFPLILFAYPLVMAGQGVDVSDSTYSLSNFLYFREMEGMWVVSTYLANLIGWILTKLPFGTSLLGMNLYTGILVSFTALFVYQNLRRWMPAWIVFAGEFCAIGFLWIPTTILYNYLTYLLFTMGAVFLYRGLVEEKDGWLFLSGVMLGMNVFVRIPNITEAALILGLWYYSGNRQKEFLLILKKTGICMAGYFSGLALPLGLVLVQYGIEGLLETINALAGIQSTDASYSLTAMVTSVFLAYFRSSKWFLLLGILAVLGMGMFAIKKDRYLKIKKIFYLIGIVILLRFFWGRGMYSFRYYEDYTAMYEWGMIGLFLSWTASFYLLAASRASREEKLMAVMNMIILAVTPLGSNNYTYQNLNNLFLAAPFTLYTFVKLFRYRRGKGYVSGLSFPWKALAVMAGLMIFIQSTGFHLNFCFRDGMDGSKRDTRFTRIKALEGMRSTRENVENTEGLYLWLEEGGYLTSKAGEEEQRLILYGDCPGLSFLYRLCFAISTAWPDLDSYPYADFVRELEELSKEGRTRQTLVILRSLEPTGEQTAEKKDYLIKWMKINHYDCRYENSEYSVYVSESGRG